MPRQCPCSSRGTGILYCVNFYYCLLFLGLRDFQHTYTSTLVQLSQKHDDIFCDQFVLGKVLWLGGFIGWRHGLNFHGSRTFDSAVGSFFSLTPSIRRPILQPDLRLPAPSAFTVCARRNPTARKSDGSQVVCCISSTATWPGGIRWHGVAWCMAAVGRMPQENRQKAAADKLALRVHYYEIKIW